MITKSLNGFIETDIQEASNILKNGGIVALPTETVYGLAADATNIKAIEKIFLAKNRPINHPLILHIKCASELLHWAVNVCDDAKILAKTFWPGAITLLLNKSPNVNNIITAGLNSVAVRVSAHPIFTKVLEHNNLAVVAPSANIHKKLSPTKAGHVLHQMNDLIDAVLDGGSCLFGIESTIVDLTTSNIKILRAGPINQTQIEQALGKKVQDLSTAVGNKVSGSMLTHYQPNTKMQIVQTNNIENLIKQNKQIAVLYYSNQTEDLINKYANNIVFSAKMPIDFNDYASMMYSSIYEADKTNSNIILLEQPPQDNNWLAINDRLLKACHKDQCL